MSPLARAVFAALALAVPAAGAQPLAAPSPADAVLAGIGDLALADLLRDVLHHDPRILAARARALAAEQVAPQVTALPDPMLDVTAYLRSPDGRQAAVEWSQEVPAAGKRRLAGEAARHEADAAAAELEAVRLASLTEARELWLEIAGLDEAATIVREEREALVHFEDLARARYESGEGLQQDVVKLQAEITRSELDLVGFEEERLVAAVALNALRGRPGQLDVGAPGLPDPPPAVPPTATLVAAARAVAPDVRRAQAMLAAAAARIELARRRRAPDLAFRGGWMSMADAMDDRSGLADDEVMVGVGIRLPVRSASIAAGIEQSVQEHQAALADRDASLLDAEREAVQVAGRFAIARRRLALQSGVLGIQADEALRSSESAYATGLSGSIDLLDAERELYEIRRESSRARLDLALAVARLEGVIGASLSALTGASEAQP